MGCPERGGKCRLARKVRTPVMGLSVARCRIESAKEHVQSIDATRAGGLTLFCQSFGSNGEDKLLEMLVARAVAPARFPSIYSFANLPRTNYG